MVLGSFTSSHRAKVVARHNNQPLPSPQDEMLAMQRGIPGVAVSTEGNWYYGPSVPSTLGVSP
jgi:hypothetical protein